MFPILDLFETLGPGWLTQRLISNKVHRLFVTLNFFRPDGFVQLLNVKPILILLSDLLVSLDLVYTGICVVRYQELLEKRNCLLSRISSSG